MGYTTDFYGEFDLDRMLDDETYAFLVKFNETRRMKRDLGTEFGVEGEFFVGGGGYRGQGDDASVIDHNTPPRTQPGLWCQWRPSEDRMHIVWDEGEKFYDYVEWITYLIDNVLAPRGYVLNGSVQWQGEDGDDQGRIIVKDNVVRTQHAVITFADDG